MGDRRVGRPRLAAGRGRDRVVVFRVTAGEYREIEREALRGNESISAVVRRRVWPGVRDGE